MGKDWPKKNQNPQPPKPPYVTKVEVDCAGDEEKVGKITVMKYKLGIQVIWNDNVFRQSQIRFTEGGKIVTIKDTGYNGFIEHEATPFSESERTFSVRVLGSAVNEQFTLPGPRKIEKKSKEKAKTIHKKIEQIPGGFKANFKHTCDEYDKRSLS